MLITSTKKTYCQIQLQRKKYLQHINRLVELKQGISSQQLKKIYNQKKLKQTINQVRKIHEHNRIYRKKCMKVLQKSQKQNNYRKIKSVLKHQISHSIPFLPIRRKNTQQIHEQNARIYQRLCSIKSNLNIHSFTTRQYGLNHKDDLVIQNDFSDIYRNSRLGFKCHKIVKIKLGNSKDHVKGVIFVNVDELVLGNKRDGSVYALEFGCAGYKMISQFFQIIHGENLQIHIKVPTKNYQTHKISARLLQVITGMTEKLIQRYQYTVQQIQQDTQKKVDKNLIKLKLQLVNYKINPIKQNNIGEENKTTRSILIR